MFTGLVQGMGSIAALENRGQETRFRISLGFAMENLVFGESIAVNGACLTVEEFGKDWFTAYASAETMSKTNLGNLRTGSKVNLERALALGDRLGGHLVSGHVDCLASVESVAPAGQSFIYRLTFSKDQGKFVVAKGSVALDGISLTVNECGPDFLTVNIIPATQSETTISGWKPGYAVNMETDVIGKYVQNMIAPWTGQSREEKKSSISMDFLRENGF